MSRSLDDGDLESVSDVGDVEVLGGSAEVVGRANGDSACGGLFCFFSFLAKKDDSSILTEHLSSFSNESFDLTEQEEEERDSSWVDIFESDLVKLALAVKLVGSLGEPRLLLLWLTSELAFISFRSVTLSAFSFSSPDS